MAALRQAPARPPGGREMRRHILEVALQLFATNGYARTSTRDIARAAGMSDAGIYYHFRSKRELIEALYEESELVQGVERLEQYHIEDGSPAEILTRIAVAALEVLERNREILKLVINEALTDDEAAISEHRDVMQRWVNGMAHVFQEFIDAGKIRPIDPQVAGQGYVHAIWGAFVDNLLGTLGDRASAADETQSAMADYVSKAVGYLLDGLQPASGMAGKNS